MVININELEGRVSAVAGGVFLGGAVYEGAISFVQSMTSVDQALSRLHGDVACFSGLLFLTALSVILRVSSHSDGSIDHPPVQDYPNVNA